MFTNNNINDKTKKKDKKKDKLRQGNQLIPVILMTSLHTNVSRPDRYWPIVISANLHSYEILKKIIM